MADQAVDAVEAVMGAARKAVVVSVEAVLEGWLERATVVTERVVGGAAVAGVVTAIAEDRAAATAAEAMEEETEVANSAVAAWAAAGVKAEEARFP